MICMPDSLLLTVTSDDSVDVTSGPAHARVDEVPLELMTGDGLSAEDSIIIWSLSPAPARFCRLRLDCKVG